MIDNCRDDCMEGYKKFTLLNVQKLDEQINVKLSEINKDLGKHKSILKQIKTKFKESTEYIIKKTETNTTIKINQLDE